MAPKHRDGDVVATVSSYISNSSHQCNANAIRRYPVNGSPTHILLPHTLPSSAPS